MDVISIWSNCITKQEEGKGYSRGSIILSLILFMPNYSLCSCILVPLSWLKWSYIHQESHHLHPNKSNSEFYWLETRFQPGARGRCFPWCQEGPQQCSDCYEGTREMPWKMWGARLSSAALLGRKAWPGASCWGRVCWSSSSFSPPWGPLVQQGRLFQQDLGLRGIMLPAWRGRPGGDRDIWWEFLTAELCIGLGCQLI